MTSFLNRARRESVSQRPWTSVRRWPDSSSVREAVHRLRASVAPAATCLGPVFMADGLVVPLVTWNAGVLAQRIRSDDHHPAIDRLTLRHRLDASDHAALSPVSEVVFIGFWAPSALDVLGRLRGYGRTILLLWSGQDLDDLAAAECDWRGISVASVNRKQELRWLVETETEPSLCAFDRFTNLRCEQLLDVAQRARLLDVSLSTCRPPSPLHALAEPRIWPEGLSGRLGHE